MFDRSRHLSNFGANMPFVVWVFTCLSISCPVRSSARIIIVSTNEVR